MDLLKLTTTLTGERVELVPIDEPHEEPLFAALDHDEVWQWIPVGRLDRTGFAEFFAWLQAENAAQRMGTFVSTTPEGEMLGTSSYLNISTADDRLEIGASMLTPSAWGSGANVEAKLLMLGHAFDTIGAQRVEFKTDARNERSRGALTALPATFEGVLRKHMNTAYGVRDSAYYSVIDDEWPAVRAELAARLSTPSRSMT